MTTSVPAHYRVTMDVALAAASLVRWDLESHGIDADFILGMPLNTVGWATTLPYSGADSQATLRGAAYAAHTVRLWVQEQPDPPSWEPALEKARYAINSAAPEARRSAGLDLRRATIGEHLHVEATRAAEGVGQWLMASQAATYVAAAAKVARWVMRRPPVHTEGQPSPLRDAWYAAHGGTVLRGLSTHAPSGAGRPSIESSDIRAAQRFLAQRTMAAITPTRTRLAKDAGVTRVTLNAWLGG
ncbi:hypothetical protein J2Y69_003326 [Microbacterium resistens]|uniref:Uncharacterized protein n=1 Tax=Microbacterium resistens TaxID=156977 RepID=A0ABU1SIJ9_9MICO|nr:hypothetical protein [Microbacterium resistens]